MARFAGNPHPDSLQSSQNVGHVMRWNSRREYFFVGADADNPVNSGQSQRVICRGSASQNCNRFAPDPQPELLFAKQLLWTGKALYLD
jgi:hypothetical protein